MSCPYGWGEDCPVCRAQAPRPLWTRHCLGVIEMERAARRTLRR